MRGKSAILGLILTWLAPGAGHYYVGRKGKAIYYFLLISAAYAIGLILADFCCVNVHRFPYHYAAEIFYGSATLLAQMLTENRVVGDFNRFLEHGTLFSAVAGLLNAVVMVDFFETWWKDRWPSR